MYFAAIIDWYRKSILSWKLSNGMDTALVIDVLKSAIEWKRPIDGQYFN
jgi:putative transposase